MGFNIATGQEDIREVSLCIFHVARIFLNHRGHREHRGERNVLLLKFSERNYDGCNRCGFGTKDGIAKRS